MPTPFSDIALAALEHADIEHRIIDAEQARMLSERNFGDLEDRLPSMLDALSRTMLARGADRLVFELGLDCVLKIPKHGRAVRVNIDEYLRFLDDVHGDLAQAQLVEIDGVPALVMERVSIVRRSKNLSKRHRKRSRAHQGQLGITATGKVVAFDYGAAS